MTLHVVHRSAPGSNRKRRPEWFSKWLCLASFAQAVEHAGGQAVTVEFLCDGAPSEPVSALMHELGRVEVLPQLGNSGSYLYSIRHAIDSGEDRKLYFVEDDYLHLPLAVALLSDALSEAPIGTYLSPYDHPDRYTRTDDLATPGRQIEMYGGHHWRRIESANMTFASTTGTLRRDRIFHVASSRFTSYPHDRALWRAVQGLGSRRLLRRQADRSNLFSAVPSLATHAEAGELSPLVDWTAIADGISAWMSRRGLPEDVGW